MRCPDRVSLDWAWGIKGEYLPFPFAPWKGENNVIRLIAEPAKAAAAESTFPDPLPHGEVQEKPPPSSISSP